MEEEGEIRSLVEKIEAMEGKLSSAAGSAPSFEPLIGLCADLTDIIENMLEISRKRSKIEHAAFDTKIKFSRKVRRKAKDLGRLEWEIVREFDRSNISLEHGRKMAQVVKLLKANNPQKAQEEAKELYQLLETYSSLRISLEQLEKKRVQLERRKRDVQAKLSDIGWLEKEPAPDEAKITRHEKRLQLLARLGEVRLQYLSNISCMPLPLLIRKAREESWEKAGFPTLSQDGAQHLIFFLEKSGLGSKSAEQLLSLCSSSSEKLRHVVADTEGFRREVLPRKGYLQQLSSLPSSSFLSIESRESAGWLKLMGEEAAQAAALLGKLEKTAADDAREWERAQQIEQKKAALAGAKKEGLLQSLRQLEGLERLAKREEKPASTPSAEKAERKGGLLDALRRFLHGS